VFKRSVVAAVASLIMISGCDRRPTPAPPRKAVLMVTWLVPGQPPATTQTVLSDMASCHAAQLSTIAAGDAARAQRERQNAQDKAEAMADLKRGAAEARKLGGWLSDPGPEDTRKLRGEALPQVTAYCIEQ
jgi:hypothetical protein